MAVEHRDRFCRFGSQYMQAAQGESLLWWMPRKLMTIWWEDMTEIWTSIRARLDGKRATANRTKRALTAAATEDAEAA
jgi:predicted site-specific integrase-resolvase